MIVHVWRRAAEARTGPVVVVTPDREIAQVIETAGGHAFLSQAEHQSGSDRIAEALGTLDPGDSYDTVVNLQGDLPVLDPETVHAPLRLLSNRSVDVATSAAVASGKERDDPNVVKAVIELQGEKRGRALYFTRVAAPSGDGPHYHHIGLYVYRRPALEAFVSARPSLLERRERLEQLRALAIGLHVAVAIVDTVPLGVDTKADLARAREMLERHKTR
jgi:3-deoxy-manno-octulosonate cytidylyltransferase (CMP-KDO synthetase)